MYRKIPKFSDTRKIWTNPPKFEQKDYTIEKYVQKVQMEWQTV